MQIHFQCRGIPGKDDLLRHFERRAAFSLDRFRHHIRRVRAKLWDDNGPRGGADKRCRLTLDLSRGPQLHVEAGDRDPRVAVDLALDRASRSLARSVERSRAFGDRIPAGGATP